MTRQKLRHFEPAPMASGAAFRSRIGRSKMSWDERHRLYPVGVWWIPKTAPHHKGAAGGLRQKPLGSAQKLLHSRQTERTTDTQEKSSPQESLIIPQETWKVRSGLRWALVYLYLGTKVWAFSRVRGGGSNTPSSLPGYPPPGKPTWWLPTTQSTSIPVPGSKRATVSCTFMLTLFFR